MVDEVRIAAGGARRLGAELNDLGKDQLEILEQAPQLRVTTRGGVEQQARAGEDVARPLGHLRVHGSPGPGLGPERGQEQLRLAQRLGGGEAVDRAVGPGRGAGVPVARERAPTEAPTTGGRAGNGSVYRFAAAQTLGQAEMLLTSFRAETRARGTVDPQVAEWAGEVLASTRLLLDSPAGRDPKTRALLEDVELVLAQIVQLRADPAGAARGDADLIDHALQQRDLLPRLRTAVPAGAPVGT